MPEETTEGPVLGSGAGSEEVSSSADGGEQGSQTETTPVASSAETVQPSEPTALTRETLLGLIPEEIRSEAVFQNINEENPVADMAAQFLNAQKLVGVDKMPVPREDWSEEQWGQLYDRLGRPESMDGYALPESEVSLDEKSVEQFREIAHKNGLTKQQFEAVVQFHNDVYGSQLQQSQEQTQAQVKEGITQLQQEWGDNFQENLEQANRFFSEIKDESLKELINSDEVLQNHPGIIKHFHRLAMDNQEAAVRTGDSTNPSVIRSSEQAQAALRKFEQDNQDILFKRKETMSMSDKQRLDDIVERRAQLYKLAFPE